MWHRFTPALQRVVEMSGVEAAAAGAPAVGAEHLLLGLLHKPLGLTQLLIRDGVTGEGVRRLLAARASRAADVPYPSLNAGAEQVLANAVARADRGPIGTHHLLLSVLSAGESAGAAVVRELGADPGEIARELDGILEHLAEYHDDRRPASYDVHIAPTRRTLSQGTSGSGAPNYWRQEGFDLKRLIAEVFSIDESRIDWPDGLDDEGAFDVEVHLPEMEGQDAIYALVRDAIRHQFKLAIEIQSHEVDAYVMTAASGPAPGRRFDSEWGGGMFTISMAPYESPEAPALRGVVSVRAFRRASPRTPPQAVSGSTDIDGLCRSLAGELGRPFINDTGLAGSYELKVRAEGGRLEDFFDALRDQAGLVVTPAHRAIQRLVVRRQ